jgi:hypothetical protein
MYLIDNVYFRYRRHKNDGNTKKQCGQKPREFNNDAYTNNDFVKVKSGGRYT